MTPYTTVTLGDFEFADFEVPENIPFGTTQKLNRHTLIGGKRVIDALGPTADDMTWTGWLTGPNALDRGTYLEGLCQKGHQLPLTWSRRSYTIVIESARFDFRLAWRIQYTITCTVVSNDTAPVTAIPSPSAEQVINDDMTEATTMAATVGNTGLTGALASVQSALKGVSNFATASLAQIKSVLQPINAARAQVTTLMSQAGTDLAQLGNLASLGGLVPNPVSSFTNGLAKSVIAAQQTGTLAQIDARLGRMTQNINAVTSGTKSVTTGTTTLFAVAASQYGDATDWTQIAQANGLTDPAITGITTLTIPAASSASMGGVLNA